MNATEVQGASKEVGAKVVYQGREMIVSEGVDSDAVLEEERERAEAKRAEACGSTCICWELKAIILVLCS